VFFGVVVGVVGDVVVVVVVVVVIIDCFRGKRA
jgi:hypothetical protein